MTTALAMAPAPKPPETHTETMRAVSVPRADYTEWGDMTAELRVPGGTMALRPIQSAALHAIRHAQGGLFPIGVGHGKTLIALLAGTVLDAKLAIVLTKAGVVAQMQRDYLLARRHFRLVPVKVMSHSTLSAPGQSETLSRYAQAYGNGLVVVADECHDLKRDTSARTKRVKRLLLENECVRFVALSGTITTKSVKDYAHLAEWSLRASSPVPRPRDQHHLDAWATCLDANGQPSQAEWGVIWPLLYTHGDEEACPACLGAQRQLPPPGFITGKACPVCGGSGDARSALVGEARQDYARRALRNRLANCVGVVATTDGSLGTGLIIRTVEPEVPAVIRNALDIVSAVSEDPEGDVLPDDISRARVKRTLSAGFYQKWRWPNDVVDEEWLKARRGWNSHVREQISDNARDGYDSPLLVHNEIRRQLVAFAEGDNRRRREPIHAALERWDGHRHKRWDGEPTPPSVPLWLDLFFMQALADLLEGLKEPAIVWYQSKAVESELRTFGIPIYGAGTEIPTGGKPTLIAASLISHGTGRNLQDWACNVVVEPPSSGATWEQLIGRTHRPGQQADEVSVYVFTHGGFGGAVETARRDARYIESTSGNRQKLNMATWIEGSESMVDLA